MPVFKKSFILILFFLAQRSTAQEDGVFVGVSVGPETVLSFPKLNYTHSLGEKDLFVSAGGSAWFFFAFWYSADASVGMLKKNISLESGLSYWREPAQDPAGRDPDPRPSHHMAFNPKLGFKAEKVWVKLGPSFVFDKNYHGSNTGLLDMTKIGGTRFNVEIFLILAAKMPNESA